jgi:NNP family nitrate/nitrite transporter-like MFS transporter
MSSTKGAFMVFTAYYVLCALVTWAVYLRKSEKAASLAVAGV